MNEKHDPEQIVVQPRRVPTDSLAGLNGLGLLLHEQRRMRRANAHGLHYRSHSAWDRLHGRRLESTARSEGTVPGPWPQHDASEP